MNVPKQSINVPKQFISVPEVEEGLLTSTAAVVSVQPVLNESLVDHLNSSLQALQESVCSVVAGLVRPILKVSTAGEQRGRQGQKPVRCQTITDTDNVYGE